MEIIVLFVVHAIVFVCSRSSLHCFIVVFEGVLVICQYEMEMGEPLFDV